MRPTVLLRTYALAFLLGWGLWLWLDKSGPPYVPPPPSAPYAPGAMPGYPGYPSYAPGVPPAPAGDGDATVQDFQHAVDLLKAGYAKQSFIALWRKQSWVLAGVMTVLVALVLPLGGRLVDRLRRRSRGAGRAAGDAVSYRRPDG